MAPISKRHPGIVLVVLLLIAAVGCGTSSSPRAGLSKITADQKELAKLDGRAAVLPGAASAELSSAQATADALATETDNLVNRVRGEEPAQYQFLVEFLAQTGLPIFRSADEGRY